MCMTREWVNILIWCRTSASCRCRLNRIRPVRPPSHGWHLSVHLPSLSALLPPHPPTALFSLFVGFLGVCLFFRTWGFSCFFFPVFFTFWIASLDFSTSQLFTLLPHLLDPPRSHLSAALLHPITKPRSLFVPQPSNRCVYRMKNNRATKHMHAVHSWSPLSSEEWERKREVMPGLQNCNGGSKQILRLHKTHTNNTFTLRTKQSHLSHNTNSSDFPVGQETGNGGFGDSKIYFHLFETS